MQVPSQDVRKQYTIEVNPLKGASGWGGNEVTVVRMNSNGDKERVFSYKRNYPSMLHTFEPFRQLQGDAWHDYALISSDYLRFEVLDLESGTIIAEQPWVTITQEQHDKWLSKGFMEMTEKYPVGSASSFQFCPADFYVPAVTDEYTQEELEKSGMYEGDIHTYNGSYGFYSGCEWGDDYNYKLRYIDLSRVSEGVVTADARFGYFPLPAGRLSALVDVVDTYPEIRVAAPVNVNVHTGKSFLDLSGLNLDEKRM